MARLPVIQAQQPITPAIEAAPGVRADESVIGRSTAEMIRSARSAADTAFGLAEHRARVQQTVALGKASADATRELDQYRQELDKDPDYGTKAERFQKRAQEVRKKYGDQFGDETQARFLASFDATSLGMENSVRHAARQDEVQQGRLDLDTSNQELILRASTARNDGERDAILQQVRANLDGAVQAGIMTAAQHKAATRQYLSGYEEAMAQRMLRTNPGGAIAALGDVNQFKYLDPVRREVLRTQAQTRLETLGAAARIEARVDAGDLVEGLRRDLPPADYSARLEAIRRIDPKLAEKVEAERRASASVAGFRVRPLTDQQTILSEYQDKADKGGGLTGEERSTYLRMAQVHAQELQRWAADPFQAALLTSPTVKELFDRAGKTVEDPGAPAAALDASVEWQRKNGVSDQAIAVVSRGQAKQIVADLQALDGAAFNQRWAELKQQYGGHFDILKRQLAKEGQSGALASVLETASELPDTPAGQVARGNWIDAGKMKDADLGKLYADNNELKTVTTSIEEKLADFRLSLGGSPGGMQTAARYRDDAIRLAASFMMQGLKRDAAVDRAVEQLVGNHYAFLPDNGGQVRVPRTVDGAAVNVDTVRANLRRVRDSLAAADLVPPPDLTPGADPLRGAEAFVGRIKQYSRWMTSQGGRSAVLMYEANGRLQPVLRKDGNPVSVEFTAPAMPALAQPVGELSDDVLPPWPDAPSVVPSPRLPAAAGPRIGVPPRPPAGPP